MPLASLRPVFRLFPLLLLCLPRPGTAQVSPRAPSADTLTVDVGTAIVYALKASPEVAAVATDEAYARARYGLARASRFATEFSATTAHAVAPGLEIPDPSVPEAALYLDPNVRNDWEDLRPFNRIEAQLLQPIYTWGELGGNIRAARYGVEVEEAEVRSKALEVALRTGELYYSVLLTDALFRLTAEAGDIVERAQREIRRLLDEGAAEVDDADLFQVQITEQEYRRRVVEVTQKRQTAHSALARQLFLPDDAAVTAAQDVLTPIAFTLDSLDTYFALALANRPELEKAKAGLAARDALVDVARSDYFPKLFLGIEARYSYAAGRIRQPNPYISDPYLGRSLRAGLGLRQKLNFAQTHAKVEQAEAERNEVRYQMEAAQQLILFEVEEAYRNLLVARAALASQEEALTISREWLRTEQINFDLDLGDTENLVKAVQASLQLEASYYEAIQKYNVAVLRLLRATGVLVRLAESGTLVD